jgi:hypothetical protein
MDDCPFHHITKSLKRNPIWMLEIFIQVGYAFLYTKTHFKFGLLDTLDVNLGFLLGRLLGLDGEQFLGFGLGGGKRARFRVWLSVSVFSLESSLHLCRHRRRRSDVSACVRLHSLSRW